MGEIGERGRIVPLLQQHFEDLRHLLHVAHAGGRHVDRVARRGVGHQRFQFALRLGRNLGQGETAAGAGIGGNHADPARAAGDGQLGALREATGVAGSDYIDEFLKRLRGKDVVLAEDSSVNVGGAGEGRRMGGGGRGADRRFADLEHDHRLPAQARRFKSMPETAAFDAAFQVDGDHAGHFVVGEMFDAIGNVDIALVARRHPLRHPDAALAQQNQDLRADRAALAHHADSCRAAASLPFPDFESDW